MNTDAFINNIMPITIICFLKEIINRKSVIVNSRVVAFSYASRAAMAMVPGPV